MGKFIFGASYKEYHLLPFLHGPLSEVPLYCKPSSAMPLKMALFHIRKTLAAHQCRQLSSADAVLMLDSTRRGHATSIVTAQSAKF